MPSNSSSIKVRTFKLVAYIISVSRRRTVLAALFLLFGSFTEGLSLILLLPLLQFIGAHNGGTTLTLPTGFLAPVFGSHISIALWLLLFVFVLIVCLSALFGRFKTIYMADLLFHMVNKLRAELFQSIAFAKWSAVVKLRKADLDHVLTGDIDRVQAAAASLFLVGQSFVFLLAYVAISACLSLRMTLLAALTGGALFLGMAAIRRKGALFGAALTEERQKQYRTISDFLTGLKVTKSFNGEYRYLAMLDATLDRMRQKTLNFVKLNSLGGVIFQCASVSAGCIFIYLAYAVYGMELARIVVLLVIFMRIAPRFKDIQDQYQSIIINLPAFEAMQAVKATCDAEKEDEDVTGKVAAPRLRTALEFKGLGFSYGESSILKDINLSVPAGKITAILGRSGSGKSTLADLAMGLLTPSLGEVVIDGKPLDALDRRLWRTHVAYMPQDTLILAASVSDNLKIARDTASDADLWNILKQAHATDFIARLPNQLAEMVGDGGVQLSGGERQRLALARALLREPELLVLDEATSALDEENTDKVIDTLIALRGQTTVLLITHNPAVARCADHIITIDDGRIKETR